MGEKPESTQQEEIYRSTHQKPREDNVAAKLYQTLF